MSDPSPQNKASEAKAESAKVPSFAGQVMLGKTISINHREPLPHLDQGDVRAFSAVEDRGGRKINCFALLSQNGLVPRRKGATIYKGIRDPSLVPLAGAGVVYWPLADEQRYAFVYENNISAPLCQPKAQLCLGWDHDKVIEYVFKPLHESLAAMKKHDFFHGYISPANLYSVSGVPNGVVLGPSLAVPAGYNQSVLCETIERGMAEPIARGEGAHEDDVYALGATLALMMRDPTPELMAMNPQDIVRAKFEEGSYAFLVGRERIVAPFQDLLKGMLNDDPNQRWDADDIAIWLAGKRPTTHPAQRRRKGSRGLNFGGKNYFYVSSLALDLPRSPDLFTSMVEDGQIEQWLTRSIDDKEVFERFETASKGVKNQGRDKSYDHVMTACVRSAFVPEWPVYYRGRTIAAEGFDTALAQAFERGDDLKVFHELIDKGVFINHLYMQEAAEHNVSRLLKLFEECRTALRQARAGFGLERCLYALNRNVNCLSPRLKGYFVTSSEEMITAFEALAGQNKYEGRFLDRQSIAFLLEVDARCIDGFLYELNSPEKHNQILGNLKCLAHIQKRYQVATLPNLARSFIGVMESVYGRYHDRAIRERVEAQVQAAAKAGDLAAMAAVLEDNELQARDLAHFKQAMLEYYRLSVEYQQLSSQMKKDDKFGQEDAHMFAALVSGVVSFLILLTAVLSFTSGYSLSLPGFH